ncbi:MAG: cupin domain-containing protein [Microbacterium sp.]|nr:cupin domain-containing protein [Microbacterium sp.]MDP3952015.1 cupin domain-containing protein [Microbacterium sp.]
MILDEVSTPEDLGLDAAWPSQPTVIRNAASWTSLLLGTWKGLRQQLLSGKLDLPQGVARRTVDGQVTPLRIGERSRPSGGESWSFVDIASWHQPTADVVDDAWTGYRCDRSLSVFWSGPASTGFPTHYDTFHSILVQLSGSKAWRLGPGPIGTPSPHQTWPTIRGQLPNVGKLTLSRARDVSLSAGEALWLPPGWLHAGAANPKGSLHATWGLIPYSWAELIQRLAGSAHHLAALRHAATTPRASMEELLDAVAEAPQRMAEELAEVDLPADAWVEEFPC